MSGSVARVAVIGAGMAGVTCARSLADAGLKVQMFDKSRGVGGRMATRRVEWSNQEGALQRATFDHGSPGFSAHADDFACFVDQALRDGLVAPWLPTMAPGSHAPQGKTTVWVPVPDMPSLCRGVLADLPILTQCCIDVLRRDPAGWCLEGSGTTVADGFNAVVVAIPPAQATPLLRPHRSDWALRAQALPMCPGWTLMGITSDDGTALDWDLARPPSGPLSLVVRNDAKPGRGRVPGLAQWVVHASASWSQAQLESSASDVQAALQEALAHWLGHPLIWHHAAVHRWRYAAALPAEVLSAECCWWDAPSGLGVCGDALGGAGVEGAWLSGRALATAVIEHHCSPGAALR